MLTFNLQPVSKLKKSNLTKGDIFSALETSNHEFDCALPQDWLDKMGRKYQSFHADLIRSTCVVAYIHQYDEPEVVTSCKEVFDLLFRESVFHDRAKWHFNNQSIFDLYEDLECKHEIYQIRVLRAFKDECTDNAYVSQLIDELANHFHIDLSQESDWVNA